MRRVVALAGCLLGGACSKAAEPAPMERPAAAIRDAGADADAAPPPGDPDWRFDPEDPAKDYVGRYLRATLRYGADTACVLLSRSTIKNGESVVEVRNPADGSCGHPAELRDTFVANVAADRMRIEDAAHRPPLRPWPDGSAPDSAPSMVASVSEMHTWKNPLHDVVKKQQLYPVRVQLYGRGTYPVITIAGWHAAFDPAGDVTALQPAAKMLCDATRGAPMAFLAELDRHTLLRVECPGRARWEKL
jgi:hypothetical protein